MVSIELYVAKVTLIKTFLSYSKLMDVVILYNTFL